MRLVTWSLTDNLLEIVTTSILMVDAPYARLMSGNDGGWEAGRFLFSSVFTKEHASNIHHNIPIRNTQPIRSAPHRLHPEKREFLRKELDDLLEQGIIEESESPLRCAAPAACSALGDCFPLCSSPSVATPFRYSALVPHRFTIPIGQLAL